MKDSLFKGLVALVAGSVTWKAIKEVRSRRLERELYEQIEEDASEEK